LAQEIAKGQAHDTTREGEEVRAAGSEDSSLRGGLDGSLLVITVATAGKEGPQA
jgi:hypothetical protein